MKEKRYDYVVTHKKRRVFAIICLIVGIISGVIISSQYNVEKYQEEINYYSTNTFGYLDPIEKNITQAKKAVSKLAKIQESISGTIFCQYNVEKYQEQIDYSLTSTYEHLERIEKNVVQAEKIVNELVKYQHSFRLYKFERLNEDTVLCYYKFMYQNGRNGTTRLISYVKENDDFELKRIFKSKVHENARTRNVLLLINK